MIELPLLKIYPGRYVVLVCFLLFSLPLFSQKPVNDKPLTREIGIAVDNDYPFMTDQYYTAGQDFYYRFLTSSKIPFFPKSDSTKTIVGFHYGNKVFNPKNLDTQDPYLMDRPYCGWNFISAEIQQFKNKNSGNFYSLQVGVVGKESGMGELQQWWHQAIQLYAVEGWDSQISNEVVVNLNYIHAHAVTLGKDAEIVSSTGAWLGTGSNKISQEFTLRLLKFNPLRESSFLSARLTQARNTRNREFFFFGSAAVDYVISNIFIQGSLFNDNPSPFTTSINPWFMNTKIGIQYSSNRISCSAAIVHLSKETEWVSEHNYASASIAYRY